MKALRSISVAVVLFSVGSFLVVTNSGEAVKASTSKTNMKMSVEPIQNAPLRPTDALRDGTVHSEVSALENKVEFLRRRIANMKARELYDEALNLNRQLILSM